MRWADKPHALAALFLIAVVESSVFPIPPDVLLIAIVASSPRLWLRSAALCTAGSVIGAAGGYLIGAAFMATLGQPIVEFYNAQHHWAKVVELYNSEWGVWFLAAAAFTPIPYKVATIAAGATGMAFVPFLLVSLVGRAARFFLVAASSGSSARDPPDSREELRPRGARVPRPPRRRLRRPEVLLIRPGRTRVRCAAPCRGGPVPFAFSRRREASERTIDAASRAPMIPSERPIGKCPPKASFSQAIFSPTKTRTRPRPYFSRWNFPTAPARRKKSARSPRIAQMFDVKTRSGSRVIAKIAGTESIAKTTSDISMKTRARRSGVPMSRPPRARRGAARGARA
jgi:Predicted membrane protein